MADSVEFAESELKPERTRMGCLARASIGLLVVFAVIVLLFCYWYTSAENRFQAAVADLRRSGEPVSPVDLAPPSINDDDNGFALVLKGSLLMDKDDPTWQAYDELKTALPLRADEREKIRAATERFYEPLELLDQAQALPRGEWTGLNLTSPVILNLMLPSFNESRSLARLVCDDALVAHEDGREEDALRGLHGCNYLSRRAEKHPSLVGHLVAVGMKALVVEHAAEIASDLRIGNISGEARPEDVRKLIDVLLDDASLDEGLRLALRAERVSQIDAVDMLVQGQLSMTGGALTRSKPASFLFRPILNQNGVTMIEHTSKYLDLYNAPNYRAAASKFPPPVEKKMTNLLASILAASYDRAFQTQYRIKADCRLAATARAIRWYRVEHADQWPTSLDDLVPKYLPAVPVDPWSADGKAIVFVRRDGDLILYSISDNEIDDGGSEAHAKGKGETTDPYQMKDRVQPLARRPRPEPEPDPYGLPPATMPEGE